MHVSIYIMPLHGEKQVRKALKKLLGKPHYGHLASYKGLEIFNNVDEVLENLQQEVHLNLNMYIPRDDSKLWKSEVTGPLRITYEMHEETFEEIVDGRIYGLVRNIMYSNNDYPYTCPHCGDREVYLDEDGECQNCYDTIETIINEDLDSKIDYIMGFLDAHEDVSLKQISCSSQHTLRHVWAKKGLADVRRKDREAENATTTFAEEVAEQIHIS